LKDAKDEARATAKKGGNAKASTGSSGSKAASADRAAAGGTDTSVLLVNEHSSVTDGASATMSFSLICTVALLASLFVGVAASPIQNLRRRVLRIDQQPLLG
jgi:hypothetical protein